MGCSGRNRIWTDGSRASGFSRRPRQPVAGGFGQGVDVEETSRRGASDVDMELAVVAGCSLAQEGVSIELFGGCHERRARPSDEVDWHARHRFAGRVDDGAGHGHRAGRGIGGTSFRVRLPVGAALRLGRSRWYLDGKRRAGEIASGGDDAQRQQGPRGETQFHDDRRVEHVVGQSRGGSRNRSVPHDGRSAHELDGGACRCLAEFAGDGFGGRSRCERGGHCDRRRRDPSPR